MMQKQFERYMGKQVKVLDPGSTVAKKLKTYLERHPEIESLISKSAKPKRQFLTTDDPATFKRFAESYLSMKISKVEKNQNSIDEFLQSETCISGMRNK